jgi:indolepyruvate ferredoxin oxidoreductase
LSCAKGLCPSFVEVDEDEPHEPDARRLKAAEAEYLRGSPSTIPPTIEEVNNICITGVGAAGVLTVGALIGLAAHLDGKASTVIDFTGFAQKNGAVVSPVKIARQPIDILI